MPPKRPAPTQKRATLRIKRAPRVDWKQETWNDLAKKYAEIEIRYMQGGGKAPGFQTIMNEAQLILPEDKRRAHLKSIVACPSYFQDKIKDAKRALTAMRSALRPVEPQLPVEEALPAEEPDMEIEGIAALLQQNQQNQERLEAKLDSQQAYMVNIFAVLEAVLTVPPGTKSEELLEQPAVKEAMAAMVKPEVILAGIRPKYVDEMERQYGKFLKLRIYPLGETRKLAQINGFGNTKHVISASTILHSGLKRILERTGLHLIELSSMTGVRKTLDSIVQDPKGKIERRTESEKSTQQ